MWLGRRSGANEKDRAWMQPMIEPRLMDAVMEIVAAIKDKSATKRRSSDLMAQGLDLQTQQRASNTTRMRPPDAQLALGLRSGVRYVGHS